MKFRMNLPRIVCIVFMVFLVSCNASRRAAKSTEQFPSSASKSNTTATSNDAEANSIVSYAETFLGVPYKYGGTDPNKGFDCSGFVYYVFNHFGIKTPRVSTDFGQVGEDIPIRQARRGDLILFTGSNPAGKKIGHIGIVTENDKGEITFIHSSSGKSIGVIYSGMNSYFKPRYVKTVRLL